MELTEKIESINRQLIDLYGIETSKSIPMWRVVWSDGELEKRLMEYDSHGNQLLMPEVREVRKYGYIRHRYVLEQLVNVPSSNISELAGRELSYEPIWVFQDAFGGYLPPRMDACKFIIDMIHSVMGKSSMAKYVDTLEDKESRVDKIQAELFGNETDTGDALAYKEAIVVPEPMKES